MVMGTTEARACPATTDRQQSQLGKHMPPLWFPGKRGICLSSHIHHALWRCGKEQKTARSLEWQRQVQRHPFPRLMTD